MECPKCNSDAFYIDHNDKGNFTHCEDCNTFFSIDQEPLKVHRVVCPQCDGTGRTVNPAIDGNGLSSEDFAEDPDFAEDYFSGKYDIKCSECHGNNVIDEVVEDWDNPAFVAMVHSAEEDAQSTAYSAAERAMGA